MLPDILHKEDPVAIKVQKVAPRKKKNNSDRAGRSSAWREVSFKYPSQVLLNALGLKVCTVWALCECARIP